jgi:hypothetical protein
MTGVLVRFLASLVIATVIITVAGAMLLLISGVDSPEDINPYDPRADAPAEVLTRSNRALIGYQGYAISVSATNFVLPQWGGSDSGTVRVGNFPAAADASLYRTGDGPYSMRYVDSATYFQRETCDHFARVPGGGRETMLPFLWGETKALQNATNPVWVENGDGPPTIEADVQYVGRVQVEVDQKEYLPVRMMMPVAGSAPVVWEFGEWGDAPVVEAPSGEVPDRGPGGNPC